ncbi:hypothetical protein ACFPJ1_33100 [Kribbella qitaiheensis]|uniref:hypothetical protein n=1 Tax=Kribbella qitaiheensis TaxID=1544730 RepID=UPI003616A98C
MPPPGPEHLPAPSELLARFSSGSTPVRWDQQLPSTAEITQLYGAKATAESLRLLERTISTEPRITAQFLAAMPPSASAHRLECRIKSPDSLARKLHDLQRSKRRHPPDDLLRYTAFTEAPDTLVDAARETCDELRRAGWQIRYAKQSYTEGSRYKGIHGYFVTPSDDQVEVQFHSVASMQVKDATRPWYEIERDARSSPEERLAAREECVRLSATLQEPPGIGTLTELGGLRVAVSNYSDHRKPANAPDGVRSSDNRGAPQAPTPTRSDGIGR